MYILSKLILLESLGLVPIGGGGGLCSHEDLREGEGGRVGADEVDEEADGPCPALVQREGTVGHSGAFSELLRQQIFFNISIQTKYF